MSYYPRPEEVNTFGCPDEAHKDDPTHNCVHDWRVHWGNVDRQIRGEGG